MTMIIRFLDVISNPKNGVATTAYIKKHFLDFVPLKETTGAGMAETIIKQLGEMSLSIKNLRGQGYDNGRNMRGENKGVQRRILDVNPRALFIPCCAHTLNLAVNDAVKCCLEATAFFDLVQHVYVFFYSPTRRWEVLTRYVSNLTVKPLSETRWESRIDALKLLRYQLGDIYDALAEFANDTNLTGASGNSTRVDARFIANAIFSFKFVFSLVVWYDVLFEINMTSKQLQAKDLDMHGAINYLKKTKKFLVNRKNEMEFKKILVDAVEIAVSLEIPALFEPEPTRIRRKNKQFTYEGDDEPIQDPKENFKKNFYFAILDTAIQSVEERFTHIQKISSLFGFLYDVHSLQDVTSKEVMEHCLNLEKALQHGDSKDIDAADLGSELKSISRRVERCTLPLDLLNFILKNNLADCVPNTVIALRILLTLPVSVASGERSFSKLKLIKTFLRTSMQQERLAGLATLSIEHEIARNINLMELVSTFAKTKARKGKF
ncbi:zinc finger MYM-type protein 1-like [Hydra vulgaris]|uniref:Zinc finger MYM-type protein 1-like n=1 Tax=Hydra vulgaris TaxID=6087 RepID=A0ABM4BZ56_HYDVU